MGQGSYVLIITPDRKCTENIVKYVLKSVYPLKSDMVKIVFKYQMTLFQTKISTFVFTWRQDEI